MIKVTINKEDCIGCGICAKQCPEGFGLNEEMKAVVKNPNAPGVKEAAEACPVAAITVEGEAEPLAPRTKEMVCGFAFDH